MLRGMHCRVISCWEVYKGDMTLCVWRGVTWWQPAVQWGFSRVEIDGFGYSVTLQLVRKSIDRFSIRRYYVPFSRAI